MPINSVIIAEMDQFKAQKKHVISQVTQDAMLDVNHVKAITQSLQEVNVLIVEIVSYKDQRSVKQCLSTMTLIVLQGV